MCACGHGLRDAACVVVMASRSRWKKPSLLRNFERNKARRNKFSGVRRTSTPFSVATLPAGPQPEESAAPSSDEHDSLDDAGMDGGLSTNNESDIEPRRYYVGVLCNNIYPAIAYIYTGKEEKDHMLNYRRKELRLGVLLPLHYKIATYNSWYYLRIRFVQYAVR